MQATNPNYTHKYNPLGPVGCFLTFHTYGTWFHGDKRGSIDRKSHNIPGTPMISPEQTRVENEKSRLKQPPVTFTITQRDSINATIREVIAFKKWILHAVVVRTEHVHIVLSALKTPESVMNTIKSWCTRRMREQGVWNSELSPWSRHGSTRYLWNEEEIVDACNYVVSGHHPTPSSRSGHGISAETLLKNK